MTPVQPPPEYVSRTEESPEWSPTLKAIIYCTWGVWPMGSIWPSFATEQMEWGCFINAWDIKGKEHTKETAVKKSLAVWNAKLKSFNYSLNNWCSFRGKANTSQLWLSHFIKRAYLSVYIGPFIIITAVTDTQAFTFLLSGCRYERLRTQP